MSRKKHRVDFTNLKLVFFSAIIGTLTGAVIASFRITIEKLLKISTFFYHALDHNLNYLWLVIPVFVVVAFIICFLIKGNPNIQGSGIPQVEAQLAGNLETNWWSILWRKFIAGVLTIGIGTYAGREGPSVQLGGAVGQGVAAGFRENGSSRRLLIAAGAASGLSATFNAPLAGTFFILEGVYHSFAPTVWISSLTGAICANFVSLYVFGLTPILPIQYSHSFQLQNYWQLILFGIVLGVLGYIYNRGLLRLPLWYAKLKLLPWYMKSIIPIALVIPVGMLFPKIIGGGSSAIMLVATQSIPLLIISLYLLMRFVFGLITDTSGIPGGIFMPILAVGALIGAAYGGFSSQLGLLDASYTNNLIIFGMAGCFAAVSKDPFTSIILIMELVGNTKNFMPLSLVVLIAYITTDMMGATPVYQTLAQRLAALKVYLTSRDTTDQTQVPVYPMSAIEGKRVADVDWPKGTLLITIKRGNLSLIPKPEMKIKAGDTLVILGHRDDMGYVNRMMKKLTMRN